MKKVFCAMSLVPSLLIASGVIFASGNGSIIELSDADATLRQLIQEQKNPQGKPPDGGRPGHPGQPNHPPQPQPQPPQPPKPVDTTQAHNAGLRDGSEKGMREGKREGREEGLRQGERDGRRNGDNEGASAGRAAGKRDGWGVDQAAGTLNGSREGQKAGTNNGIQAGERRCYDEGYSEAYNVAYAAAKELGLQDAASYSAGYAKGQADAAVIEVEKGQKAGYQAGFSQREKELRSSFTAMKSMTMGVSAMGLRGDDSMLPLEVVRGGFATPEEKQAYERGFREGYQRAYRRAFDDAKRDAYNESYRLAYRRAYDSQYSFSYRQGYSEGKEQGYQEAYSAAYNSAYNAYFQEYKNREYDGKRAEGMADGRAAGDKEGFEAGCAVQRKRGYDEGYQAMAAQVYPGAFEAGKQAGIAAADRYYAENSVLEIGSVSFYDEDGDGKFEAGENVMMRAEVKNFGFRQSESVVMAVKSERGEIVLVPELRADGVGGRAKTTVNLNIGKLYDVVSPNSDALFVKFTEQGKPVGDFRQVYMRTNDNKVGIVAKEEADVLKKPTWFFPGKVATLNRGDKVLITEEKGDYFKVRKSAFLGGEWTEGYMSKGKLDLQ
jgi:flagellar biosynthesis/type III secretory pathway protein FliH